MILQDLSSIENLVSAYSRLLDTTIVAPTVSAKTLSPDIPVRDEKRLCALLITPHPDDEALTGGLALRLLRDENWQIVNVAVTLGSNKERQHARCAELAQACAVLGFDATLSDTLGFSDITLQAREDDPATWVAKASRLADIISATRPRAIIMPHENDWHTTHIGTHWLAIDALAKMPSDFSCTVIQTEYWQPLCSPNLAVGIGEKEAAVLLAALSCHQGEVIRNAYDRRFPAFLIDAARRVEKLAGKGQPVPAMAFAQLYETGLWTKGRFVPSALKRIVGPTEPLSDLFT